MIIRGHSCVTTVTSGKSGWAGVRFARAHINALLKNTCTSCTKPQYQTVSLHLILHLSCTCLHLSMSAVCRGSLEKSQGLGTILKRLPRKIPRPGTILKRLPRKIPSLGTFMGSLFLKKIQLRFSAKQVVLLCHLVQPQVQLRCKQNCRVTSW